MSASADRWWWWDCAAHRLLKGWGLGFAVALPPLWLLIWSSRTEPVSPVSRTADMMLSRFGALWWATGDPILNLVIDAALLVLCLYLGRGAFFVGYYAFVASFATALAFWAITVVVLLLVWLATVSPTGAGLVALIIVVPAVQFARSHHTRIAEVLAWFSPQLRVAHPAQSVGVRRALGGVDMADRSTEENLRRELEVVRAEIAGPPLPRSVSGFQGWIGEARARLEAESMRKTAETRAELLAALTGAEKAALEYMRTHGELEAESTLGDVRRATAQEEAQLKLARARAERRQAEFAEAEALERLKALKNPPPKPEAPRRPTEAELKQRYQEEKARREKETDPGLRENHQRKMNELLDRLARFRE